MKNLALALVAIPLVIVPALVLVSVFAMGMLVTLMVPRLLHRSRQELVALIELAKAREALRMLKRPIPEESKC